MVQQALDVVLADITGNSAMVAVKHSALKTGMLLVEVLHVVHCVAPAEIMADRYLPPLVVRSLITPEMDDISELFEFDEFEDMLDIPPATLHKILDSQFSGLKEMLAEAQTLAMKKLATLVDSAMNKMIRSMNMEIDRLKQLMKVNNSVRPEEMEFLNLRKDLLTKAIDGADMRMEAIRVIVAA